MAYSMNDEQWLPIPGFGGAYEASDLGRIRSVDRTIDNGRGTTRFARGQVLALHGSPYLRAALCVEGRMTIRTAHSLVAETFIGPAPGPVGRGQDEWQVNHKNSVKTDNRPANLEWTTGEANMAHAVDHALHARGEEVNTAVLTADIVRAARLEHAKGGTTYSALGRKYGVSNVTMRLAVRGDTWKHVE